jgi:hypothetical protein
MARIAKSSEIQALMENELKGRRKVILVCLLQLLPYLRALLILISLKRSVASARKFRVIVKSVASARLQCIVAEYAFDLPSYRLGLSDAALEDPQDLLPGRVAHG